MADYDTIGGGTAGTVTGAAGGAMAGGALGAKIGAIGGPLGMAVGGLLGGLFGSKKTKVQKPPSYEEIMNTNLNAQENIQGRLLGLESKYRPKYQTLQEQTLNRQLYGGDGTEGYISMLNRANTAFAGVQQNAANSYMNTLGGLATGARNLVVPANVQAMQNTLFGQAQSEINAGTGLNANDQRLAYQNANTAMAMRGLGGRQGVAAGVLANYQLGLQRQDRARQFAGQVMNSELGLQQQALNVANNAMNTATIGGQFMGQANQMLGQYQPQIFQPESQAGMQAQGMQYQHNMALARAQMQAQQGMLGALGSFGAFALQNPSLFNFGGSSTGGSIFGSSSSFVPSGQLGSGIGGNLGSGYVAPFANFGPTNSLGMTTVKL